MPPSKQPTGSAREWMDRAKGKLALARVSPPSGAYLEDLCFFAQQAVELAVKAVYQCHEWTFPFVHDLGTLLDGLERNGLTIPSDVQEADQLTVYAVETRYPGIYAPVTQTEYEDVLRIAEAVLDWADGRVP